MHEDLSRRHAPVTGLFDAPAPARDWRRYALTGGQVEFNREHGYAVEGAER